jgi:hypothetical protein
MFATATVIPRFGFIAIFAAVLCLFAVATSLSNAASISRSVRVFLHRPVEILAWDQPLPETADGPCRIESLRAFGAGLHLFIKCPDGCVKHLKIAQPRAPRIDEHSLQIGQAAYVQWAGRKLPVVLDVPALSIRAGSG